MTSATPAEPNTPDETPAATAGSPTPRMGALRGGAPGGDLGPAVQAVVVGVGLWVISLSLLATLLGSVGLWRPWLVLPLAALGLVSCVALALRLPAPSLPGWSGLALVAVAVAAGAWTAATHSEQVLPRRDSGSYLQQGISLADTGRRVVPVDPRSVGGAPVLRTEGLVLSSPAFYQTGTASEPAVQPQFVIGPAAVWSLGRWLGGVPVMLVLPALIGAVGLLGIGTLTAATVGGRWAALAALATGVLFPVLHTARSTYSEPLALVTLTAGLTLLVAAARSGPGARWAALAAGLLVGGTAFVRIDGLRESILLVVVIALYAGQRRPWARHLAWGVGVSTVLAGVAALALSYRYLGDIAASLVPLVALGVALSALAAGALVAQERGVRLPRRWARRLPGVLAGLTVLTGLFLASRPLWQTVRQSAADPGARVVAGLQQRQGLPVDGGRTYAEQTVAWLAWWVGPVALVVALVVLAVLMHRSAARWVAGEDLPVWVGPLLVAAGSSVATLWRPGITPDHPWAERRLLIVLPLVVVLVVAAAAWVVREGLARRLHPVGVGLAAGAVVAALVVPAAVATAPHVGERVEAGELAAVERVCAALGPKDVALMVDSRAANEWPQVVRGQCGRAAVSTTAALRRSVPDFVAAAQVLEQRVRAGGGRVVLLAAEAPESIGVLGALSPSELRTAVDTTVLEDARTLERRPDHLVELPVTVWLATLEPAPQPG